MMVAVASGKGGTGKTTVAVNVAHCMGRDVALLDCDVEEPNAHVFIKGSGKTERVVTLPVPEIDEARCDGCGECSRFCAFNAIVCFGDLPVVAAEMCHGCGGCTRVCPQKAIHEVDKRIGVVETSQAGAIRLVQGRLDVGVALAPPLIRAVKERASKDGLVILDAPPGTSCPVIATLRDADYVVLVTEPTPFGLHDLKLAVAIGRHMDLPLGVVINRSTIGDDRTRVYCGQERLPVLAEIPDDRRIAKALARGEILVEALPEYRYVFEKLSRSVFGGEVMG
jgi:MinD superfamily P-loop ATPase